MRGIAICSAVGVALSCVACKPKPVGDTATESPYAVVAQALLHPRCVNCHPSGDQPLITDASRPHGMQVMRGPEGRGITTTMCTNCHQTENLVGEHMPPGAAEWRMPPANTPMVFEGKNALQLCEQITDPTQNGGKSVAELLVHLESDAFVKWGWDPGEGRAPVPGTHATFVAAARAWIEAGARCE